MNILSPIRLIQNTYMNVFDSITMLDFVTNNTLDFNYFNIIYFFLPLRSNEPLHDRKMSFHVMTQGLKTPDSPEIMEKAFLVHMFQGWKCYNLTHTPLLRPQPSRFKR